MSEVCPINGCSTKCKSVKGVKSHCTKSHSDEENPFRLEKVCSNCKKQFSILKSQSGRGRGEYCSNDCKINDRNVIKFCNNCGKKFSINKSRSELGYGKYCSMECLSAAGSVDKICNNCDEQFTICKSQIKSGGGKYCSEKCLEEDKYYNDDLRNSKEYRKWKKLVLKRDNKTCQDCGSTCNIQCHHIVPIYQDKNLSTDVDNGVTLCKSCHAGRHRELNDNLAEFILSRNS